MKPGTLDCSTRCAFE